MMAKRSKQTMQKRQKERARMEKQKRKEARRLEAKERRASALPPPEGVEDPDIAHIKPGPQPLPPEFTSSLDLTEEEDEDEDDEE